jgi:hypothetical protein
MTRESRLLDVAIELAKSREYAVLAGAPALHREVVAIVGATRK